MGSCIKKKHPNCARSCLRQADVPWLVAQMLLVMPRGWGWAGFVPPWGSLQRGAPISASPFFQPPVAVLAGGASPCRIPMPGPSRAGGSGRVNPEHPQPTCSPFPTQGIQDRAALPAPSCRCRLLLSCWQHTWGRLALINMNTASAAPFPLF